MMDSPANNYCTWSDLTDGSYASLTNGSLEGAGISSDSGNIMSSWHFESGKWYTEIYVISDTTGGYYPWVGVSGNRAYDFPSNGGYPAGGQVGQKPDSCAYVPELGKIWIGQSHSNYGNSFTV